MRKKHLVPMLSLFAFMLLLIAATITDKTVVAKDVTTEKSTYVLTKDTIKSTNTLTSVYEVTGTFYHAVSGQCDDTPLITADNAAINLSILRKGKLRWVALSRDLLHRWGGPFNYGDTLYVHHPSDKIRGLWYVHDCMNERYKKRIDFLIDEGNNQFPHMSPHILITNHQFYTERHD